MLSGKGFQQNTTPDKQMSNSLLQKRLLFALSLFLML